jgi:hypothetical protein
VHLLIQYGVDPNEQFGSYFAVTWLDDLQLVERQRLGEEYILMREILLGESEE